MKSILVLGSIFLGLAQAMCDHRLLGRTEHPSAPSSDAPHGNKTVSVGQFSYDDLRGPLNWHGLSTSNKACVVGRRQSPIDITDGNLAAPRPGRELAFRVDAQPHGGELENLGTTLEVPATGSIVRDNVTYSLRQLHFHTPSEHRVFGEYYPMEAHFVFQSAGSSMPPSARNVLDLLQVGICLHGIASMQAPMQNLDALSRCGNSSFRVNARADSRPQPATSRSSAC